MLPPDRSQTLAQTHTHQTRKANTMSQLRTAKAVDVGAFPGSTFVVDDTPPIAQCQEAQISQVNATVLILQFTIDKTGAFAGINLAGQKVTVTNTIADNGTYNVLSNDDDCLTTDHEFQANDASTTITVQDAGETFLTRNEPSFQRFIENKGKAHTTKGGQLYTDVASVPMADACSDTFDPQ